MRAIPVTDKPPYQVTVIREPSPVTRWLAVLLLVVAGALIYTVIRQRSTDRAPVVSAEPRAITPRGDLAGDEQATIELFQNSSPSVVHITSLQTRRVRLTMDVTDVPQGTGTGFIWDQQGHVVTNYHVVAGGDHASVTLSDNTVWRATIIGAAKDKDLAVLKIDAPTEKLRPIAVGTSSNLQVGQKVFAIGNPFGLDQTLTTGVISGLGREIKSVTQRPIYDVIQTDAPINPGNSGGPLLDSAGRIIGINTAIYSPSGAYAGIGFAVPIDSANSIVPQLISHGRIVRPGIGIGIARDDVAQRYRIDGVIVMSVTAGSSAAKAGVRPPEYAPDGRVLLGDVIVGIDDHPVSTSADLYRGLDPKQVGDKVKITVRRQGGKLDIEVPVEALPEVDGE
jgi:S1-C subfamily serine protease